MKRVAIAVLLSGLIAFLTMGLAGCGASTPAPIGVGLTSNHNSIDQSQTASITASVTHDAKSGGVQWSVSGGGTLSAQTATSATYNAPASVTSAFTATVTATSITDTTKTATLQIKVSPLPTIAPTPLPQANAGTPYSAAPSEAGGTSPYTWSVTPATLPAGLSLNSSTGVISGMPTGGGSGSFTFQVADAAGMTATQALTVTVNPPPALAVSTTSLPAGTMSTAYSQTLQATGGVPSYKWSLTGGSLPAGLSLSSAGVISGTPSGTFTGTSNFTVTVTDSQTPTNKTATANLSITVSAPPLSVTTKSLPGGTIGNAYGNQPLQASGGAGAYTWAVTTGSLPAGLSLNGATGVISGTPSGTFVGTTSFTVTVTDSETPTAQTASAALSITITVAPLSVTTSGSLPVGVVSSIYSGATLQATGGIQPYSWTVTTGSLPAGLILNSATGTISGTPTSAGTSNFTVTVTDSETPTAKTATANLSIVVNPALSVTTNSLPPGVIGTAYSQTLTAAGGISPYTWSVTTGSLPAGLALNANTGVISGTPSGTFTGTTNFTVTVTDNESPTKKTATANLSITISAPPLSVTTPSLPGGTIGTAYSQTLQATGGISPYTWAVTTGSLPVGLTLNPATGVISGTPSGTFVGTVNFTVTVTDSETPTAGKASANLSITITVGALSVTTNSLPQGIVNSVYAGATLQATGGIQPYSWAVTTGSLPAGLVLNPATGAISGTPTGSGTTFTVTVTDSETPTAQTATKQLTITVNPQLSITTTSLAPGTVGTSYSQTLTAAGGITPYSWAVTAGSLPAGLTLNASTGAITGKPTGPQVGIISFTVTVTDSESPTKTANANLSITISAPPLSVTTPSLPCGTLGQAYSATLAATGGITPYSWSISVGALPAGLTLNAGTGVISGTPTGSVTGPINFTVKVTDSESPTGSATAALSITIAAAPLSVTTASLPTGVDGSAYSTTLQAAGGVSPYTWAVTTGALPTGLTLNPTTGVISGTPTGSGTTFTVTVTDSETPTAQTATKQLTITVNPQLSITTTSLAPGTVGTSYSQTLTAAGGITPYSWAVTAGSLPAGLTLNASTGAITGKPTGPQVGIISFTVTVTDSESPTKTANANLSITISAPTLTITTGSLPTGVLNQAYSATLAATGGITPYTWSISAGSLPPGLTLNAATGAITGTDSTQTGPFNFTVQVTDSESPSQATTKSLSITINNSAPLQITTTGLPTGVINTPYSSNTFLSATGGIQPYTWSYTGSLPPGLTLTPSTGQISGTPTSTGTFNFTAKVTDSSSPQQSATANLSITINAALTITTPSLPNGSTNVQYNATVNASGGIQPYSWSITSGSLPPGLNPSNNNNSLDISGTPTTTGNYTFTVQVADNESPQATSSQSYTIVIGNQPAGYTVSGTVSYGGSKTGWVYLQLNSNNCGGCGNNLGTSVKTGGAFTIHGVQPGTYTLQAFMDNLGYGGENASNPTGSTSNVTVTNSNVSGVPVALSDPGAVTLNSAPTWGSNNGWGASNGVAFVSFQPITNNNGIEMAASYTVQWSTSSSFGSVAGSTSFPATGGHNNTWIVSGLTNGQILYFRAQGVAGSSTSPWSGSSSALTIGLPTGGNAVSGTVTFTGTAKGPLYVGFYDQNTGNIYADVVGSKANPPKSPAAYSVNVPTGNNYYFFGIIDQNNNGLVGGPGEISNVNGNGAGSVSITGPMTNENLILPSGNSAATVRTQSQEAIGPGGTNFNYSLGFNVNGLLKLPVAVELATGPAPGVVIPADIAVGVFNGNGSDQFSYWASLNGATPKVGDSYTLNVTYSDGTTDVLTVTVGTVLNAFATNLSPQGSGVSTTPNFSWTDPANTSSYTYQFWLCCDSNGTIWQIPGNNSKSNGFSSSITSITWGVDPTGQGNLPNVSSLNGSTNYSWQIQAMDTNGNSAQVQVSFETVATPLTLPAAGNVGNAVVNQSWSGGINASGGVPNYTFTVNGSTVPTDGTQVSLGDNLFAWNTGGNTLSLGGTPSSTGVVSFTVAVTDSASNTAGPYTYTITVGAAVPLSIETTSLPGGNNGWVYSTSVKATGGVQPYTWTVISGSLPSGLSISSNGGNNGIISGTPSGTGTANFTVQVTDNVGSTATQALSIAITNCTYTALNGNYAFLLNGWKNTTDIQATVGSFVANGAGTITSGVIDINDQTKGPQNVTISGTYCVNSNNLALVNIVASGKSGSATFAATLDSTGNGHIIRYDNTSSEVSSGLLRKQTTSAFATSKINGNYAFGFVGVDGGSDNRFAMAGEFNSNGSGTLSGEADYDSGGSGSGSGPGNTTLNASNFQVVSSTTGRGTVSVNFTGPGATLNFVFYVVSASELLVMDDDTYGSGGGNPLIAGQVLQQSGSFTDASLNGVAVVEAQALDTGNSPATPDAQAGFVTTNGTGSSFAVTLDDNDGGTVQTESGSGTYSVASNGRVTISLTGENHPPVFYLTAKNQGFVIGTDGMVSFGTLTPQTGSSFTNASLSGNYLGGSQQPVTYNVSSEIDASSANGAGMFNVTSDNNSNCGSGSACPDSSTISGINYAVSGNGRVVVTCGSGSGGNCPAGTQVGIMYIISTSQAVFLSVQDSDPKLDDFHQ